jgi:hypothetical protein
MAKKGGVPENLKSYVPGQSGNPAGKPKGCKSISTYLKMYVEGNVNKLPEKLREQLKKQGFDSGAAALAYKKVLLGLDNNVKPDTQLRAIDSIEDRLEGKATQKTELTGKDGESLAIKNDNGEYENSLKDLSVEELVEHQKLLQQANNILEKAKQRKGVTNE